MKQRLGLSHLLVDDRPQRLVGRVSDEAPTIHEELRRHGHLDLVGEIQVGLDVLPVRLVMHACHGRFDVEACARGSALEVDVLPLGEREEAVVHVPEAGVALLGACGAGEVGGSADARVQAWRRVLPHDANGVAVARADPLEGLVGPLAWRGLEVRERHDGDRRGGLSSNGRRADRHVPDDLRIVDLVGRGRRAWARGAGGEGLGVDLEHLGLCQLELDHVVNGIGRRRPVDLDPVDEGHG